MPGAKISVNSKPYNYWFSPPLPPPPPFQHIWQNLLQIVVQVETSRQGMGFVCQITLDSSVWSRVTRIRNLQTKPNKKVCKKQGLLIKNI